MTRTPMWIAMVVEAMPMMMMVQRAAQAARSAMAAAAAAVAIAAEAKAAAVVQRPNPAQISDWHCSSRLDPTQLQQVQSITVLLCALYIVTHEYACRMRSMLSCAIVYG